MKDKHGRKCLDQHLLARFARARRADLHGLRLRDMCECVLNSVYRITLRKEFGVQSLVYMRAWKGVTRE
jgi:hypothetical protein